MISRIQGMKLQRIPSEQGSILIGAIALAVLVSVAVSLAIRSSQIKIREVRDKEANIEARLAMDSAAARIITLFDTELETGPVNSQNSYTVDLTTFNSWFLAPGQTLAIKSGKYTVAFNENDVIGENKAIDVATMAASAPSKDAQDPLFPDMAMSRETYTIKITARAQADSGMPSFQGMYTFQIRAIPVTEWTLFNPGSLRERVTLTRAGNDTHNKAYAYIGTKDPAGQLSAAGTAAAALEASASDPNIRFWRASRQTGLSSAKFPNAASMGLNMLKPIDLSSVPSKAVMGEYGKLRSSTETEASEQDIGRLWTIYENNANTAGCPGFPSTYYTNVTISGQNPLNELNAGVTEWAVLDLGNYLTECPAGGNILVPLPRLAGIPLPILVTNAAFLCDSNVQVGITFPPALKVFIASDVNTNGARVQLVGNIGFISPTNDVLSQTNFVVSQRRLVTPYVTNQLQSTTSRAVAVDIPRGNFDQTSKDYVALEQALRTWANEIQQDLVTRPSSPYYNTCNDFLSLLDIYQLNSTVTPNVASVTDYATNMTVNFYTNTTRIYNFLGAYSEALCNAGTKNAVANLYSPQTNSIPDPPPIDTLVLMPGFDNVVSLSTTNTTTINSPFTHPEIAEVSSYLPPAGESRRTGTLVQWSPVSTVGAIQVATAANINTKPFARAYFSIVTNYWESYEEMRYPFVPNPDDSILFVSSEGPLFRNIEASEQTGGQSWQDFMFNQWVSHLGVGRTPLTTGNVFRFDADGNENPDHTGGWKRESIETSRDNLEANLAITPLTHADITNAVYFAEQFVNRTVQFNYETYGWTLDCNATPTTAPIVNARLVVENGIRQLQDLPITGLVVNGQVTYSHGIQNVFSQGSHIGNYTVQYAPSVIPTTNKDRVFDIRIARIETSRL